MTRDELIAALESAESGSHELDVKVIAHLISGTAEYSERAVIWYVCRGVDRHGDPRSWEPKLGWESALWRTLADRRGPTRSLDAALMLFPEHCGYEVMRSAATPDFTRAVAWDCLPVAFDDQTTNEWKSDGNRSLPLNVCIAALRARKEIADG